MRHRISFCGTRKNEYIAFDNMVEQYLPGAIVRSITGTSNKFWEEVSIVADTLLEMCKEECKVTLLSSRQVSFDLQQIELDKIESRYANGVIAVIKTAKSIMCLDGLELIKKLVCLLPAYSCYAEAEKKYNAVRPSAARMAENSRNIRDISRVGEESLFDKKEHESIVSDMTEEKEYEQLWNIIVFALTDDGYELIHQINNLGYREKLLCVLTEYAYGLKSLCKEGRRLKQDIPIALSVKESHDLTKEKMIKELREITEKALPLWEDEGCEIFGNDVYKHNITGILSTSLSTLVLTEMDLCIRTDYKFKACKCCDRLFATRKENQKYCEYPNPALGGKTCKVGAAYNTYWHENELLEEYRKSYASYNRWRNRVITDDDSKQYSYMRELEIYTVRNYGQEIWEKLNRKIKDETRISFSAWNEKALGSLDQFNEGNISKKECQAALSLPSIEARSSILAYIAKDRYRIDTDYLENLGIIKKK